MELDEERLNNISDANSEINTKRQTKWAVNIFKGSFPSSMVFIFKIRVKIKKFKLEDRSQKKKIMFLHSKNKASRKGYKGEC